MTNIPRGDPLKPSPGRRDTGARSVRGPKLAEDVTVTAAAHTLDGHTGSLTKSRLNSTTLVQEGNGVPTHEAERSTQYHDLDTGKVHINSDGATTWVEIGTGGGATTFLGLTDTPASYAGQALKVTRVNAGETALEFAAAAGGAALTVQEEDGAPIDTAVTIIRVPNGMLVDNGAGDVSLMGAGPIGELGGTWVSPTVDATHSGSAHHNAVTVSGTPDYITLSGQDIVRGLIDLATDITGDLPYANLTPSAAISKLLGRGAAAGAGDWQEITLGTNLSMSGTTLDATGGAGGHTIRENGVNQPARTGLNFIDANAGTGLVIDDAAGDETEVYLDLYVLRGIGRAGGTIIYGGEAANEDLTLQGTSHGTRTSSYIIMNDSIQLAAGSGMSILDNGATARVTLAASSPHVTLTGSTQMTVNAGIGGAPNSLMTLFLTAAATHTTILRIGGAQTAAGNLAGINLLNTMQAGSATTPNIFAFQGSAVVSVNAKTVTNMSALFFALGLNTGPGSGTHAVTNADLILLRTTFDDPTGLGETMTITRFSGLTIDSILQGDHFSSGWALNVTNTYGIYLKDLSTSNLNGTQTNVYAFKADAVVAGTNRWGLHLGSVAGGTIAYLLELGAGPTLRLKDRGTGGWTAAANETPLWIEQGATPTLRQMKTRVWDGTAGHGFTNGDLVCYLV